MDVTSPSDVDNVGGLWWLTSPSEVDNVEEVIEFLLEDLLLQYFFRSPLTSPVDDKPMTKPLADLG